MEQRKCKTATKLTIAFLVVLCIFAIGATVDKTDVFAEETTNVARVDGVEYETLASAIEAAKDGDTIYILDDVDIDVAKGIRLHKSLNFVGVKNGDKLPEIINSVTNTQAESTNGLFNIGESHTDVDKNVTTEYDNLTVYFENIVFNVVGQGIFVNSHSNDLTVKNCKVYDVEKYTNSEDNEVINTGAVFISMNRAGKNNLTLQNNTIDFTNTQSSEEKPKVVVFKTQGGDITIKDNVFTGENYTTNGARGFTIEIDPVANEEQSEKSDVVITGNTFTGFFKVVSNDHSDCLANSFDISNNKFIDCEYGFEIQALKESNYGYDLSGNYFVLNNEVSCVKVLNAGEIVEGNSQYNVGAYSDENTNEIILYPCYADEDMETTISAPIVNTKTNKQHQTLQGAIDGAQPGDTITIYDDIALAESVIINKDITIVGATGEEKIYYEVDCYGFSVSDDCNISFKNIDFDISQTLIYHGNDPTKFIGIEFDHCDIELQDPDYIFNSDGGVMDVEFTNNTVNGDIRKGFIVRLGDNNSFVMTNNTFVGNDDSSSVATIVMQGSGKVEISGNTFENIDRGFCIDHCEASGDWNIRDNKFINVDHPLNYDSQNEYNAISMAYNFSGKTADSVGVIVALLDENIEDKGETSVTLYPYYTDSALKTLVMSADDEQSETTITVDKIVEDLDIDDASADADVKAAAAVIVAVNKNEVAKSAAAVGKVNAVDKAFVDTNAEILYGSNARIIDSNVADGHKIPEANEYSNNVQGLAVALFGDEIPSSERTVSLKFEQLNARDYEGTDVVVDITPACTNIVVNGNHDIKAPVTFKMYLPTSIATSKVKVVHIGDDGTKEESILPVKSDTNGRYVQMTVTHFSVFTFAEYTEKSHTTFTKPLDINATTGGNEGDDGEKEEVVTPTPAPTPTPEVKPTEPKTTPTPTQAPSEESSEAPIGTIGYVSIAILAFGVLAFAVYAIAKKKKDR